MRLASLCVHVKCRCVSVGVCVQGVLGMFESVWGERETACVHVHAHTCGGHPPLGARPSRSPRQRVTAPPRLLTTSLPSDGATPRSLHEGLPAPGPHPCPLVHSSVGAGRSCDTTSGSTSVQTAGQHHRTQAPSAGMGTAAPAARQSSRLPSSQVGHASAGPAASRPHLGTDTLYRRVCPLSSRPDGDSEAGTLLSRSAPTQGRAHMDTQDALGG